MTSSYPSRPAAQTLPEATVCISESRTPPKSIYIIHTPNLSRMTSSYPSRPTAQTLLEATVCISEPRIPP